MGRDDAKQVAGLQGGAAPARAFAEFMKVAVAKRPVEQFETQAPIPDWQLEPDEEAWAMNYVDSEPLVDADGNPLPGQPVDPLAPQPGSEQVDQQWLDEVLRRNPDARPQPPPQQPQQQPRTLPPRQPQQQPRTLPPRQPADRQPSERTPDPLQPQP